MGIRDEAISKEISFAIRPQVNQEFRDNQGCKDNRQCRDLKVHQGRQDRTGSQEHRGCLANLGNRDNSAQVSPLQNLSKFFG